jgi:hypothetical protein
MVNVHPATAHLLLETYLKLRPDDWMTINAANRADVIVVPVRYGSGHHFLEIILGSQIAGDLVLLFSPFIGFAATGYGLMNLWDALSVRTDLTHRQRFGKIIWGLVLLIFVVNILWALLSRMASNALTS